MQKAEVEKLLAKLLNSHTIFAPQKKGDKINVEIVEDVENVDWSGDLPFNSFKSIFLPVKEHLSWNTEHGTKNKNLQSLNLSISSSRIAWGLNILDLQAFSLFEQVFEKDSYYQKRRRQTYVVGFTNGLPADLRKYNAQHLSYEENILEHLVFDIFIERKKNKEFVFFSGSEKGQLLLEKNGVHDYQHIEFAGLVPEQGPNPVLAKKRKAIEENSKHPLWKELAEICLACGKCSIACPTCFCFDQKDETGFSSVQKIRQWTTCFYPEFSQMGPEKQLDTVAKRLYFWYFHKFVRIPEEFTYYGCVGCGRCVEVCPVGIDIKKNLKRLQRNSD